MVHCAVPVAVLHVTVAAERGGAEGVIETIVSRAGAGRFRMVLATPRGGALARAWRERGWVVIETPPVARLARLDQQLAVTRVLARELKAQGIGVVHTHGISAQIQGGWAGRLAGVPVICHAHDRFEASWSIDGLLHLAAARTPRAHTIAVSKTVAESLAGRVGSEIEIIPNGVDGARVAPSPEAPPAPLVVWCGRLQRWKGCHLFVRAAKIVHDAMPGVRFAVVGGALFGMEPEYPEEVRRLAASLGLDAVMTFTGHVPDSRPWLASATVAVHSAAREDPFPLVVLEAMMQGTPMVAFARGGPAEAIVDGVTGRLVAPDDVAALARGVMELLGDPDTLDAMGAAARARAVAHYAADGMVRRLEAVYDRVSARR